MQIIVINGPVREEEVNACIRRVTRKYPASAIEKLILEVCGDYVDIRCTLYRRRELRKMSGYCISEPSTWNSAKWAELQDTLPNQFEEES